MAHEQTDRATGPVSLTAEQKLQALSLRFYQGLAWVPKAGDHYTTSRADLELYKVVSVEDGIVRTRYCDNKTDTISSWPAEEFTSSGFGPKRVYVPDFVLSASPQDAAKVAEVVLAFENVDSQIEDEGEFTERAWEQLRAAITAMKEGK